MLCSGFRGGNSLATMARPIFVGNFEYETRQSELERLFGKYGRVERVDMKSGILTLFFKNYCARVFRFSWIFVVSSELGFRFGGE